MFLSSDNNNSLKQLLVKKGLIKNLYSHVLDEGMFIININLSKFSNWKKVDSYVRFYVTDLINNDWKTITPINNIVGTINLTPFI